MERFERQEFDFSNLQQAVDAGHALGDQGCNGSACNAPAEHQHEEQIQNNVGQCRHNHGI